MFTKAYTVIVESIVLCWGMCGPSGLAVTSMSSLLCYSAQASLEGSGDWCHHPWSIICKGQRPLGQEHAVFHTGVGWVRDIHPQNSYLWLSDKWIRMYLDFFLGSFSLSPTSKSCMKPWHVVLCYIVCFVQSIHVAQCLKRPLYARGHTRVDLPNNKLLDGCFSDVFVLFIGKLLYLDSRVVVVLSFQKEARVTMKWRDFRLFPSGSLSWDFLRPPHAKFSSPLCLFLVPVCNPRWNSWYFNCLYELAFDGTYKETKIMALSTWGGI